MSQELKGFCVEEDGGGGVKSHMTGKQASTSDSEGTVKPRSLKLTASGIPAARLPGVTDGCQAPTFSAASSVDN